MHDDMVCTPRMSIPRHSPRIKRPLHLIRPQIDRQHDGDHEPEGSGKGPPDQGVAAHLAAGEVDHAGPPQGPLTQVTRLERPAPRFVQLD